VLLDGTGPRKELDNIKEHVRFRVVQTSRA
jgi:hypothetical protein